MIRALVPLLALAALAGRSGAVDVPAGAAPVVDGIVGDREWLGATEIAGSAGSALLKVHQDALYVGIRMRLPYAGQRIELSVADPFGMDYSLHAFHPASAVPEVQAFPAPTVLVKRASWSLRDKAPFSQVRSCRFRAHVYRKAKEWSAEMAVARDALDVAPDHPAVFLLDVVDPAGRMPPVRFAPPRTNDAGPDGWHPLRAAWGRGDSPFRTPGEDETNLLELRLFRELMNRALRREKRESLLDDAVGPEKSNEKVDALLAQLDACLERDPDDFFARFLRVRLLRLANRIDAAVEALDETTRRFPHLDVQAAPLVAERFALLVTLCRFERAAAFRLPPAAARRWSTVAGEWKRELELRARDERGKPLPRIAFETTRGRIVVELFENDSPNAVAYLLELAAGHAFDELPFEEVRGGFGATLAGPDAAAAAAGAAGERQAWRGTISFLPEDGGRLVPRLLLATGHARFSVRAHPVGRVVEGMRRLDALDAGDRIQKVVVLRKRAHAYEVRRPGS